MADLRTDRIRRQVADSEAIFKRGQSLFEHGAFILKEADSNTGQFTYLVDGSCGDYETRVQIQNGDLRHSCTCPYPGEGCKHIVAALLDARGILERWDSGAGRSPEDDEVQESDWLSSDEIREQAIEDRRKRARTEVFTVTEGDICKGEHLLETAAGKQYVVALHDPAAGRGRCSCPDFQVNRLGTCKHIIHLSKHFQRKRDFKKRIGRERFPFADIYWDSVKEQPALYLEKPFPPVKGLRKLLHGCFDHHGQYTGGGPAELLPTLVTLSRFKAVRVHNEVFRRIENELQRREIDRLAESSDVPALSLKTDLYPYQNEGVRFALFKPAALIGDEMGLGKTLQAIALAILKKEVYGFGKVLIVTLASLKEQWKREIKRFTDHQALIVEGPPQKRQAIYEGNGAYFKITNYEAVLRDVMVLSRFKPDLVILDEAQRIKNFSTKTADAVKSIPRRHALVLTGTPLENKLDDVYSIVQFLDPDLLTPLWKFAADHFMLSRKKTGKILGYRDLGRLHERLKTVAIRRRKEEVLQDLPETVENTYFLDLHQKQREIHSGYMQALLPLMNKKFLTPMDVRRIQELLLRSRMVCNSTYLIDRKTHISPKLKELEGILDELVVQNRRKMVIFSEWTTMTYLIARHLSDAEIPFVELSGKIPVKKRQALIDEFTHNPDCRVFLSTDAGGTGLNLQAADCVVNFELPWSPARVNQRIGRVNRIGQKSRCINVIHLVTKNSIEEKILAGLQLKADLFKGVFDGGIDVVEFTHEKRTELLNRLREMMNEEPLIPRSEASSSEEIPDDAPYYLNPQVLQAAEAQPLDVAAEEDLIRGGENLQGELADDPVSRDPETAAPQRTSAVHSPENLERVLNQGMAFLGGLMEMATGTSLIPSSEEGRMLSVDPDTGEVTLKFKLPGFGGTAQNGTSA